MKKTSSNQEKKKKTKVRKLINRAKNGLQRVRKFCRQHVMPVMLATAIIGGVIFGTYLRATATGVEELYYTYWDLVSSIFAAEGYDMSIKNGNDKISTPDRVTGRQLWNNIKTWVKLKTQDAKEVFDEFVALPKFVTAEGITMSKELYELLGDFCDEYINYDSSLSGVNSFDTSSVDVVYDKLLSLTGASRDFKNISYLEDVAYDIYSRGYLLNIYYGDGAYRIFYGDQDVYLVGATDKYTGVLKFKNSNGYEESFLTPQTWVCPNSKSCTTFSGLISFSLDSYWVVKQGKVYGDIFNKVKDAVDLKNAPDQKVDDNVWNKEGNEKGVLPWWYYPDLLDRSMRDQTADNEKLPESDPDNGDDNKDKDGKSWKDILPALIPWVPTVVNPTETEKDSEKDSEKGTEDVAPGGKPKPGSSENPTETEKDTEKDTEEKATDSGQLPGIAEKAGNWKRLFPFCIPWDMISLVKSMKADKKAPVFEFKYTFKAVNYTWKITVDMSDYWKYIKIFRWGMTIFFIIGLFFLTVKFTTFVYKMGG